jgi:hypothetical protein
MREKYVQVRTEGAACGVDAPRRGVFDQYSPPAGTFAVKCREKARSFMRSAGERESTGLTVLDQADEPFVWHRASDTYGRPIVDACSLVTGYAGVRSSFACIADAPPCPTS